MSTASRNEARRRWARELLEIAADADEFETKRGIQKRLAECDFVPPPPWREAMDFLLHRPTSDVWFRRANESRLRVRISEFVSRIRELSSLQRQAEWKELYEETKEHPALGARVRELKMVAFGGDYDPQQVGNAAVRELAEVSVDLLIAEPNERAQLWSDWLDDRDVTSEPNRKAWRKAVADLKLRYPQFYRLAESHFASLEPRALPQRRPAWSPDQQPGVQTAASHSGTPRSVPTPYLWFAALAVIFVLRLAQVSMKATPPDAYRPTSIEWPADPVDRRDAIDSYHAERQATGILSEMISKQRQGENLEPMTLEEFQELAEKHRVQPGQP